MDLGLNGVPAAVAGASRGLGYAVARELAREGARVSICGRSVQAIDRAAADIFAETGAQVQPIVADLSLEDHATRFVQESARALGGLQVLVTNAGGPLPGTASTFADDQWMAAFTQNCLSSIRMARSAMPYLSEKEWGRILVMTSSVAKQVVPDLALSTAARAAVTGFAKTLALEVAPRNITVNCLMPGAILTDRIRSLANAPPEAGPEHEAFAALIAEVPAGRLGTPEEFAAAAAFLCSKRASFITGVSLQVDGGLIKSLF